MAAIVRVRFFRDDGERLSQIDFANLRQITQKAFIDWTSRHQEYTYTVDGSVDTNEETEKGIIRAICDKIGVDWNYVYNFVIIKFKPKIKFQ